MTFHVFADLFDWHLLQLHYVPFFLLPVFSTLFYMHFLHLRDHSLLYRISKVNLVLPLLRCPAATSRCSMRTPGHHRHHLWMRWRSPAASSSGAAATSRRASSCWPSSP
jgi:hypothetical protein